MKNRALEGGPLEIAFRSQIWPIFFRSWLALGLVLGASWGVLRCSWAVLGRLARVLGPCWGCLGNLRASWDRLEAVLRRLGDVLGRIPLPIQLENDF